MWLYFFVNYAHSEHRELTRFVRRDCWLGRSQGVPDRQLQFGVMYFYHSKRTALYGLASENRKRYCRVIGATCIDQSEFVINQLKESGKVRFHYWTWLKVYLAGINFNKARVYLTSCAQAENIGYTGLSSKPSWGWLDSVYRYRYFDLKLSDTPAWFSLASTEGSHYDHCSRFEDAEHRLFSSA